jgi:hypothetical protein
MRFLFVAFKGVILAIRDDVAPGSIVNEELFRITPVTLIKGGVYTVITHSAVYPPSTLVARMVVEPAATAVTSPELFTSAFPGIVEVQIIFLFVAFAGYIVGINEIIPGLAKKNELLSKTIADTATAGVTVTRQEAMKFPSVVLAVILAEPATPPITLPFEATDAIAIFDDDHVNSLFVAFVGITFALNVIPFSAPGAMVVAFSFNVIPVTCIIAIIFIKHVAVLLPSAV